MDSATPVRRLLLHYKVSAQETANGRDSQCRAILHNI